METAGKAVTPRARRQKKPRHQELVQVWAQLWSWLLPASSDPAQFPSLCGNVPQYSSDNFIFSFDLKTNTVICTQEPRKTQLPSSSVTSIMLSIQRLTGSSPRKKEKFSLLLQNKVWDHHSRLDAWWLCWGHASQCLPQQATSTAHPHDHRPFSHRALLCGFFLHSSACSPPGH